MTRLWGKAIKWASVHLVGGGRGLAVAASSCPESPPLSLSGPGTPELVCVSPGDSG